MANNFSFSFERANPLSREVMSLRPQKVWNSIQLMDRARQTRQRMATQAGAVLTAGQYPAAQYKPELNASSTGPAEAKVSVPVPAPAPEQAAPAEANGQAYSNTVKYEVQQQLYDDALRMLGEIHGTAPGAAASGTGGDDA